MPIKLTQQEYEARVYNAVGDKYTVIGEYKGKSQPIKLHCNIHHIDFIVSAECFMRGAKDVRGGCPQCVQDKRSANSTQVQLTCAYCQKTFTRSPSSLNKSKSGLYFCCREHKDLAQRLESGPAFVEIRPEHYGINNDYRTLALRNYPHQCAVCGWNQDVDVLQVHHIDQNRQNNDLNNLIILCPTCHQKLSIGKYQLIDRKEIVLKQN